MDEDRTALGRRGLVVPAPEAPIEVLRDLEFAGASGRPLRLDVHRPAHPSTPAPAPLVWIASGYRDEGFAAAFGCPFKEMEARVGDQIRAVLLRTDRGPEIRLKFGQLGEALAGRLLVWQPANG